MAALGAGVLGVSCALPSYQGTGGISGAGGLADGGGGGACSPALPGAGPKTWSHAFGGLQPDDATAMAVDPDGNVTIAGSFRSAASFDGNHTLVAKDQDAFVASYDAAGKHRWSRQAGGDGDQYAHAVAALADGSVVVTGGFAETIDFGCATATSVAGDDVFVAKLDACGSCVWQRTFGGAATSQYGRGIAVDAEGNVLLTGGFAGIVAFDPKAPLATSADKQNVFIVKLDPDGNVLWSQGFGDEAEDQFGTAIAVDPDGHVLVTGSYKGTLNFMDGSNDLPPGEGFQLFVVRREADGSPIWSRGFGGAANQMGLAIAVGPASAEPAKRGVVVSGWNGGVLDFGGPAMPLTSSYGADGFVAKLSYLGSTLWSTGLSDVNLADPAQRGDQIAGSVALDAKGNVVVGGWFDGAISVAGNSKLATGAGDIDAFVLALDVEGTYVQLDSYGGAADQHIGALALNATNGVHVAGGFKNTIDLTMEPLQSAGDLDIFLAKLGP